MLQLVMMSLMTLLALLRERPTLWTHLFYLTFYWDSFPALTMFMILYLWIFKYLPVSCDSIYISAPYSLIPQILDIDDEIAQPDSNRDSSDHDSDPINERISPTIGDVETIDFGIEDQPRKLKIGSPLSIDENDRLIHLLRSYLDVFAWSYEDMLGLHPSIV